MKEPFRAFLIWDGWFYLFRGMSVDGVAIDCYATQHMRPTRILFTGQVVEAAHENAQRHRD
jgi:hypothetical protein